MNMMMIIKVIVEDDDKGLKMIQKEFSFYLKKKQKLAKLFMKAGEDRNKSRRLAEN